MTRGVEASLEERQQAYNEAEAYAGAVAVRWLNARTRGPVASDLEREMDEAQAEVRRCRRKLEDTERRLVKQTGGEA